MFERETGVSGVETPPLSNTLYKTLPVQDMSLSQECTGHLILLARCQRFMIAFHPQIQRLPPLESSMIALDTLTGNDTTLSIEDALRGILFEVSVVLHMLYVPHPHTQSIKASSSVFLFL